MVDCQPGRYELLCAVGVTLPKPPKNEEPGVRMEAAALARVLDMSEFAASSKEMRYAMNGVCLSVKRGVLSAAATDGRRLAVARTRLKPGFKGEIIVPLRAVGELTRLLTDSGGDVELRVGENFLVVSTVQGEVAARLVEGRFPAYDEVIPKEDKTVAQVSKEELSRAMKSVAFLSNEEYRAARLSFAAKRVTVEFGSPEQGEGRMHVSAECTGPEVTVSLNPTFVLDVLRVLADEKVQIGLSDADGAVVFRQGTDFLYVVMPISPGRGDGTAPA